MTVYLDSSIVLRRVMGQRDALESWPGLRDVVSSTLLQVECFRTLHRARLMGDVDDERMTEWHDVVFKVLAETELVQIDSAVLSRASQPFPTVLGALDAIHLATALVWSDENDERVTFATHDIALGRAARAAGLSVIGL